MKKNTKALLLFLVLLISCAIWFYQSDSREDSAAIKGNAMTTIKLVNIDNRSLFLRARMWGVSGNHEEIVLSKSESSLSNKADDYIFYTSEVFYKIENDKNVILYAPESSIIEPLNRIPNVTIRVLKTADEIIDYHNNYQKYGLKRISIYDKS